MRFTVFTLLYLAAGVCLTAIAFQQSDLTPSFKKFLLTTAAPLYIATVLSTFRFWRQGYNRDRAPTWIQIVTPWVLIAMTLYSVISMVLTAQPMTNIIPQATSYLPLILLCIEWIYRTNLQSRA